MMARQSAGGSTDSRIVARCGCYGACRKRVATRPRSICRQGFTGFILIRDGGLAQSVWAARGARHGASAAASPG